MKKQLSLLTLIPLASILMACSAYEKVNAIQAVQILKMINQEQQKSDFTRSEDVKYVYSYEDEARFEYKEMRVNPKTKVTFLLTENNNDENSSYLREYRWYEDGVYVRYFREDKNSEYYKREVVSDGNDASQQFAYYLDGFVNQLNDYIALADDPLSIAENYENLKDKNSKIGRAHV